MIFSKITDEVVCHKYDDNAHHLLESDELTLGAMSVICFSLLNDLIMSDSN